MKTMCTTMAAMSAVLIFTSVNASASYQSPKMHDRRIPTATTLHLFNTIDFTNPHEGFIGGQGIILTSHNGGSTWTTTYRGSVDAYAFDFLNNRLGWAVGQRVLMVTKNAGASWLTVSTREPALAQVQFISPNKGFGVSGSLGLYSGAHGLMETRDGGRRWTFVPNMQDIQSVSFANSETGWAASSTELLLTNDGGLHWKTVRPLRGEGIFNQVRAISTSSAWILSAGSGAPDYSPFTLDLVTRNGRENETVVKSVPSQRFFSSTPVSWSSSGSKAWVIAVNGVGKYLWLHTRENGHSWINMGVIPGLTAYYKSGESEQPLSINAVHLNEWWMASNVNGHGELWRSSDGGFLWHKRA